MTETLTPQREQKPEGRYRVSMSFFPDGSVRDNLSGKVYGPDDAVPDPTLEPLPETRAEWLGETE